MGEVGGLTAVTASHVPITLGVATLGNLGRAMSDDEASSLLDAAASLGVRRYDAAPTYGLGLAEVRLGRHLAMLPRSDYLVSTKVGRVLVPSGRGPQADDGGFDVVSELRRRWDFSADGVRQSLDGSLDRLGLSSVDIAFLHDPDLSPDAEAVTRGLRALAGERDRGRVGRIGVATKDRAALDQAVESGLADVLMIPGRLTLLNSEALDLARRCSDLGIEILNAAPLNGGGLVAPERSSGYGSLSERERARRTIADVVSSRYGADLLTVALQYACRTPGVTSLVVGARTAHQLRDTVERISTTTDDAIWDALDAAFAEAA